MKHLRDAVAKIFVAAVMMWVFVSPLMILAKVFNWITWDWETVLMPIWVPGGYLVGLAATSGIAAGFSKFIGMIKDGSK